MGRFECNSCHLLSQDAVVSTTRSHLKQFSFFYLPSLQQVIKFAYAFLMCFSLKQKLIQNVDRERITVILFLSRGQYEVNTTNTI